MHYSVGFSYDPKLKSDQLILNEWPFSRNIICKSYILLEKVFFVLKIIIIIMYKGMVRGINLTLLRYKYVFYWLEIIFLTLNNRYSIQYRW